MKAASLSQYCRLVATLAAMATMNCARDHTAGVVIAPPSTVASARHAQAGATPATQATACGDALYIPGGQVGIWTTKGSALDASTWPRIAIGAFCVDRTEVTCAEYKSCVFDGACKPVPRNGVNKPITIPGDFADSMECDRVCDGASRDQHPMVCADYHDAEDFCAHRQGRVPMDYEWYLALKGAGGFDPSRMNNPVLDGLSLGVIADDANADTYPIASHLDDQSIYGVLDMLANVGEWSTTIAYDTAQMPIGFSARIVGQARISNKYLAAWSFLLPHTAEPETSRQSQLGIRCVYGIGTHVIATGASYEYHSRPRDQ
ncbi:hypothetical protein BH09MYX1_BH09MYX1_54860 [soil metagenome]